MVTRQANQQQQKKKIKLARISTLVNETTFAQIQTPEKQPKR